jgi:hypothetical protein
MMMYGIMNVKILRPIHRIHQEHSDKKMRAGNFSKISITLQKNHQPDATIFQFIILTFIYTSTCFGRFPPIIRNSMIAVAASGFIFLSW